MRVYKKSCSIKRINTDENDRYFTCIYSHEHCYVSDSPFNFVKKTSSVFLFQWLQSIDCESWQFENRQLKRSVFPSFFQVTVCHRAGTERHPTIRTCGQFRITSLPNHTNCMCLDCGVLLLLYCCPCNYCFSMLMKFHKELRSLCLKPVILLFWTTQDHVSLNGQALICGGRTMW